MSLLTIVITLIVVGVLLWAINAINAIIPMSPEVKKVLNVVVVVFLVLWLLQGFGLIHTGLRLR